MSDANIIWLLTPGQQRLKTRCRNLFQLLCRYGFENLLM